MSEYVDFSFVGAFDRPIESVTRKLTNGDTVTINRFLYMGCEAFGYRIKRLNGAPGPFGGCRGALPSFSEYQSETLNELNSESGSV